MDSTIKDVARASGVSIATVSRVLNQSGYVSDSIKKRVLIAVEELNYRPNNIARSLKKDKTNMVGVIVPDISNPYFMKICKVIEEITHQTGYNLIFCSSNESAEKERELLQLLYEKRVDAVVIASAGGNEKKIQKIANAGMPFILVDRKMDIKAMNLDYVLEDNVQGGYLLTKHLLDKGHSRIGLINGLLHTSTGSERYEGFQLALEKYGVKEEQQYIYNGAFLKEDGIQATRYFLKMADKPTAILSFNNMMTFGVLLELKEQGYSIPTDMVIASYGELGAAELLKSPGIIYIKQLPEIIGKKAGKLLLQRLTSKSKKDSREIIIPKTNTLMIK